MKIIKVRKTKERYGFRFADEQVRLLDYEINDVEVKRILDAIHVEEAALSIENQKLLFNAVLEDYVHITSHKKCFMTM